MQKESGVCLKNFGANTSVCQFATSGLRFGACVHRLISFLKKLPSPIIIWFLKKINTILSKKVFFYIFSSDEKENGDNESEQNKIYTCTFHKSRAFYGYNREHFCICKAKTGANNPLKSFKSEKFGFIKRKAVTYGKNLRMDAYSSKTYAKSSHCGAHGRICEWKRCRSTFAEFKYGA